MSMSQAFSAGTEAVLIDMAQRPQPRKPPEPSFSIWSTMKAAPKGVAAGAAQGIGSGADVAGAFGDVLGSLGDAGSQGMFGGLTDQERKQSNEAREKLITQGPGYTTEAGSLFRGVAKGYMPDPATAHGAEQAVANLFRVGSKALTAAVTLGNVPGAIVAGAEEGFTQSDELREQGVDLATRTKVGGVTALTNAVGFALPVAGATWKSTVGLAVAGGPASYVAQNAAAREILKDANYAQLANQYDPFDPVGLALSTLLPLGFGALAMRGAKGARFDTEAVDAARVNLLREQMDATRATPPDDLAGSAAHSQALERAIDQQAVGGRVDVSDVAPAGARITEEVSTRLGTVVRAFEEVAPAEKAPAKAALKAQLDEAAALAKPDIEPPKAAAAAGDAAKPGVDYESAMADLQARMPDLEVRLEGMDAPVKASDLIAQVKAVAKAEAAEARLLEVAAQCFLRG